MTMMMLVQPGRVKTQSLLASPEEVRSQTSHGPDGFDNYCYNIDDLITSISSPFHFCDGMLVTIMM